MLHKLNTKLLHCFGTEKGPKVSPQKAAEMILASGITQIPINTHNIDNVSDWRDLSIGYGTASWNMVSEYIDLSSCTPLWNINLPQSAREAILRTEKVVKLGGLQPIKFEVLDKTLSWSCNTEVLHAVDYLVNTEKFEVWPLIAPELETFYRLEEWGCPVIRLMGSPIGSQRGILNENLTIIKSILWDKTADVMLDGGVNSIETVLAAFNFGFDSVLVNSWLFTLGIDPADLLKSIRNKIDNYGKQ